MKSTSQLKSRFCYLLQLSIYSLSFVFSVANAEETESPYLTGSWGGARTRLSAHGLEFTLLSKNDLISNLHGGAEKKTLFLGNLDLKMAFDGEKAFSISGLSGMVYGLIDYGGKPSKYVGDTQVVTNIEAPTTAKLYEAWLQQEFFESHLSFLFGLRDTNQEFYVTDSSGLFLNSSFGVGKELAQSGQNGPSIFPTTSVMARAALRLPHFIFKVAGADGVPGDPDDGAGTHIQWKSTEGFLYLAEAAYMRGGDQNPAELPGKYAIGTWIYSSRFERLDGSLDTNGDPRLNRSYGYYFLADQNFTENFSGFARFGMASETVNEFDYNLSGGINLKGAIPFRPEDKMGLAVTAAHAGSGYKAVQSAAGSSTSDAETTLEFTYRIEAYRGIAIQPDFQYVIHPSADPSLKNAAVIGARTEINF